MHPEQEGDRYIDDGLHYRLAVELRVLVTEPMILEEGEGLGGHSNHEAATEPNYFDAMQENSKVNSMPTGRRRTAVTLAFAELGRQMTGMPVDFQFDLYDPDEPLSQRDGPRVALGGVVGGFAD